jgi:hypothetical protein
VRAATLVRQERRHPTKRLQALTKGLASGSLLESRTTVVLRLCFPFPIQSLGATIERVSGPYHIQCRPGKSRRIRSFTLAPWFRNHRLLYGNSKVIIECDSKFDYDDWYFAISQVPPASTSAHPPLRKSAQGTLLDTLTMGPKPDIEITLPVTKPSLLKKWKRIFRHRWAFKQNRSGLPYRKGWLLSYYC